jgi:hypothetical protein
MADLHKIQAEIAELSPEERGSLLAWLVEANRKDWDQQISGDFSEGGAGMKLLAEIDKQINRGNFRPLK